MSNEKAKQSTKKETKIAEVTPEVPTTYVVKSGDKISEIATRLGMSVGVLLEKNKLDKPVIKVGQELKI